MLAWQVFDRGHVCLFASTALVGEDVLDRDRERLIASTAPAGEKVLGRGRACLFASTASVGEAVGTPPREQNPESGHDEGSFAKKTSKDMTRPGLEPGISGSGGRRLIH